MVFFVIYIYLNENYINDILVFCLFSVKCNNPVSSTAFFISGSFLSWRFFQKERNIIGEDEYI